MAVKEVIITPVKKYSITKMKLAQSVDKAPVHILRPASGINSCFLNPKWWPFSAHLKKCHLASGSAENG